MRPLYVRNILYPLALMRTAPLLLIVFLESITPWCEPVFAEAGLTG